ncbi:UvrABC system protein C [compost metagenome]
MKLTELPVFFLDLQTTGAKPGTSDILEVAWGFSEETDIHSFLAEQPEDKAIPKRIFYLTGIKEEEMVSARPLTDIFSLFAEKAAQRTCVIHFAQFERPFLQHAWENSVTSEFPIICTHQIAKRLLPNLPARGIKGLAGYFGHASGEFKRGSCHVEATKVIWNKLLPLLTEQGIHTVEELQAWLQSAAPKKTKYEYPMAKEKRLGLPKQPGVYRMISQWGEILYVGKATSLHDRVNSYFRGQKNRDSRKLEMLTQAYDLRVTPCRTPLESALLETDEIKTHNPRYNISLKAGHRELVFFSKDFLSQSATQDEVHEIGPFSNSLVFDSTLKLAESLKAPDEPFNAMMFYEELDPLLLKEGFEIFCQRHTQCAEQFKSVRSILAQGLIFIKNSQDEELEEDLEEELDLQEEEEQEEIEVILTAEDIADKFERHFKRAAGSYLRARRLTKLLNADIEYALEEDGETFQLHFRNGYLRQSQEPTSIGKKPWDGHSIETYDRMSVLLSELDKIQNRSGFYKVVCPV